jgi:hypothetical protein
VQSKNWSHCNSCFRLLTLSAIWTRHRPVVWCVLIRYARRRACFGNPRGNPGVSFFMAKKVIILIDGGHLRVKAKIAGKNYNPAFIDSFSLNCKTQDEEIFRILYYDCAPYSGTVRLPVSGNAFTFVGSDRWLADLASRICSPYDAAF